MSEYAGESLAKKVARVRLYKRTREFFRYFRLTPAKAVVMFLPGPDAAEVGAIKHILGARPENVWGIDRDSEAIRTLRKRMPGANCVLGDLGDNDLIKRTVPKIHADFVHLDLMGNLSESSLHQYACWAQCSVGGIIAVTYLRGRERRFGGNNAAEPYREFGRSFARELLPTVGKEDRRILRADPERALSHLLALGDMRTFRAVLSFQASGQISAEEAKDILRSKRRLLEQLCPSVFTPVATYAYRAESSPMGVLVVNHIERATFTSPSYGRVLDGGGRFISSVIKKDPMDDLLAEADSLQKEFDRAAVAEILDVSPGTLASWRAHRTMGTYAA